MVFSVPQLVAYISDIATIEPGRRHDGHPSGHRRADPRRWLRAGDEVLIEIDGIGAIRNRVEAER